MESESAAVFIAITNRNLCTTSDGLFRQWRLKSQKNTVPAELPLGTFVVLRAVELAEAVAAAEGVEEAQNAATEALFERTENVKVEKTQRV